MEFKIISFQEVEYQITDETNQYQDINNAMDFNFLIQQLSPRQQEIITYHQEGYKAKEIAPKLGLSLNTIYYYSKLARKKLRKLIFKQ